MAAQCRRSISAYRVLAYWTCICWVKGPHLTLHSIAVQKNEACRPGSVLTMAQICHDQQLRLCTTDKPARVVRPTCCPRTAAWMVAADRCAFRNERRQRTMRN